MLIWISLLVLSVAVVTPLAAQPDDNNEVIVWSRYDLADDSSAVAVNLREKIAAFEAETGIRVVYEQVAWDQMATRLIAAVQAGSGIPDVVTMFSQQVPALTDIAAPLDTLLADEAWLTELDANDQAACVLDSVRYCVAHTTRGGITYYRTAAFPDGFPQTAAGWLAAAPAFTSENTMFSTQYAGRSATAVELMWYPMIHSNGGRIFDDEGKPAWASEEVAEVVAFGRTLFSEGYFPALNVTGSFPDAEAPWLDGSAASFRGASWSGMFVPGLYDAVNAGEVAMTGGVDFGGGAYVLLNSETWVMPNGAPNPENARAWMRAFFEPDFLATWAQGQFGVPTLPAAQDAMPKDIPFFTQMHDVLQTQGVPMPPSPYYLESVDELAIAFQEMMLDPQIDALSRLQEAQDTILRRYW